MTPTLTKKQKKVFDFISSYQDKHGISPTIEEMGRHFRRAVGTIHEHISILVAKGFIKKNNSARGIQINTKDKLVKIPLMGTVAAGWPIGVIQEKETNVISNSKILDEILKPKDVKRSRDLPLNQIILNDAVAELRKLPSESCDVIIIDPPYNIGKDFGNNLDKRELDEYVRWSKSWINEAIRILKPTGTMFIYGFSEILAHLSVEIPINKRWLIWHYTNKNVASLNFWQRSHESIICAWKNKPLFNRDEVREPYTEGFLNGAAGKVRKGTVGRYSKNGQETITWDRVSTPR